MDNRYEIAEQNGMSREFADWFFENKKAGCGNVWFMMMAAMWEGWQGRAAMLQSFGNSEQLEPVKTGCKLPEGWVVVPVELTQDMRAAWDSAPNTEDDDYNMQAAYRAMIAAAPQQEVKS
ncbi:TPA: hypothetical protein JLC50_002246 [Escherichia coli]|nr:hypothetical protein [Escherichia coli]